MFLDALGIYLYDRERAIDELRMAQQALTDTTEIDREIQCLQEEMEIISEMIRHCINENAAGTVSPTEYQSRYTSLCSRFEEAEQKMYALQHQRQKMEAEAIAIGGMMFELMCLPDLPLTFSDKLWTGTIDRVTVYADERVVFRFKDGREVGVGI